MAARKPEERDDDGGDGDAAFERSHGLSRYDAIRDASAARSSRFCGIFLLSVINRVSNDRPGSSCPPRPSRPWPRTAGAGRRDHRRDPRRGPRLRPPAARAPSARRSAAASSEALAQFADLARRSGRSAAGRPRRLRRARPRRGARGALAGGAAGRLPRRRARRLAARSPRRGLAAGLDAETLVLLAEAIFAYIDELSAESAEGFAASRPRAAGEADRRRAALVELLLREPPAPPEALAAAAEAAGWRVRRATLAVVAVAGEARRRPARRLPLGAHRRVARRRTCAPSSPIPARPGAAPRSSARWRDGRRPGPAVARRRRAPLAPAALRRRCALARGARRGRPRARRRAPRSACWCRADPALVAEIARERLRAARGETPASRAAPGGDAAGLAAPRRRRPRRPPPSSHVHPQTVRYRLARLRDLLGAEMDDPDARFELEFALRTAPKAR